MATRTKTPRWTMLALAAALAAFGGVARAGDEGEDAASLVRRARTAADVDRDAPKAITLYRKAIEVGGSGDAARDASLRLARLLEQSGNALDALEAWKALSVRFGDKLADAEKKEAHEAIGRLLPPGGHARSPLGEVFVRAGGEAGGWAVDAGSPMDAKIVALLAKYESADASSRASVRSELIQILRPVGADAVPALTRALRAESPVRARLAAELVAMFGGSRAVAALEKTILEGDPFARGAAIEGLTQVKAAPETSAILVVAVDRMLALPALADRRDRLRAILVSHLTDAELIARYDAGGDAAPMWLGAAVGRNSPAAVERVIAIAKSGGDVPPETVDALAAAAGVHLISMSMGDPYIANVQPLSQLTPEIRRGILRVVLSQPPSSTRFAQAASVVAALGATGPVEAATAGAAEAWERVLLAPDVSARFDGARELVKLAVAVPREVMKNPAAARALAENLPSLATAQGWSNLFASASTAGAAFWTPFLPVLATEAGARVSSWLLEHEDPARDVAVVAGILDAVDAGAPLPPEGARLLSQLSGGDVSNWDRTPSPVKVRSIAIDAPLRMRVLDRLLRREDAQSFIAPVASGLRYGPDSAAAEQGRKKVWDYVVAIPNETSAGQAASWLLERDVQPALAVYESPAARARIARAWLELLQEPDAPWVLHRALQTALPAGRGFWDTVFLAVAPSNTDVRRRLLNQFGADTPPDSKDVADARWFEVLATYGRDFQETGGAAWLPLTGAARTNDPRFVETLGKTRILEWEGDRAIVVAGALMEYAGPGRLEFVRTALADQNVSRVAREQLVSGLAAAAPGSPERGLLVEVANDPKSVSGESAIQALNGIGDRETILAIIGKMSGPAARGKDDYHSALVYAAGLMRLKEAIPFLLEQFRAGDEESASAALDEIRKYHERAAQYEEMARGSIEGRKELSNLLQDPDPEIRRAAVLSIAALGDRDALPQLVRIAKDEKDARVRAAALEAVERIARSPAPPSSPPPPPSTPAMEDAR